MTHLPKGARDAMEFGGPDRDDSGYRAIALPRTWPRPKATERAFVYWIWGVNLHNGVDVSRVSFPHRSKSWLTAKVPAVNHVSH
jgi:hypothetical protein